MTNEPYRGKTEDRQWPLQARRSPRRSIRHRSRRARRSAVIGNQVGQRTYLMSAGIAATETDNSIRNIVEVDLVISIRDRRFQRSNFRRIRRWPQPGQRHSEAAWLRSCCSERYGIHHFLLLYQRAPASRRHLWNRERQINRNF